LIVANCHYFIVEYDYKFCKYRSIEKHKKETGIECDCHNDRYGMFMSSFFAGAEHVFYMSEKQRGVYQERFPFITDEKTTILSSVFETSDLEFMERLRKSREDSKISPKYVVLGSSSWIKGTEETQSHLEDCQIDYATLSGLSYHDMLRELSTYTGLAFMPLGGDTCPRVVIEAKMLGLELMLNENVQHASENWFNGSLDEIESYILDGHNRFWGKILDFVEKLPTVSGYTTVRNVIEQKYPWKESIKSMLSFCDEVVVVDGGSDDGSYEELIKWEATEEKLVVKQVKRDWNSERFSVFDGLQKAEARSFCNSEWCWQQDIDEVVHEEDAPKIKKLAANLPKAVHLIALPVVEYWGNKGKVRVDVNPWKWRFSRNLPHITHGIPAELRKYDEEGNLYAAMGTDGCDYIDAESKQRISFSTFYTQDAHEIRMEALKNSKDAVETYQKWLNAVIKELPGVHHYSWFDLERKIHTYKNYWSRHWQTIFNISQDDVAENNMFFDKPWSEVSDRDIVELAEKMESTMGGWIFHSKIDFKQKTPHVNIERSHPSFMEIKKENK
jgi:glycosyltransferase involved in cell wall biosynthesis